MRQRQSRSWLLTAATKAVKYFLLGLASCTIAYIVSVALEFGFLTTLAIAILEQFLSKASVLVLCLVVTAAIAESLKS